MKQRIGYSGAQIALHWTIAVLILFNYIYSDGMGRALHARLDGTPATDLGINPSVHVWVGVAVLVLSLIRLGLRLGRGVPEPGGEGLVQVAAEWGHRLLYLLMILVPVAGMITWFGRVDAAGDIRRHSRCAGQCADDRCRRPCGHGDLSPVRHARRASGPHDAPRRHVRPEGATG